MLTPLPSPDQARADAQVVELWHAAAAMGRRATEWYRAAAVEPNRRLAERGAEFAGLMTAHEQTLRRAGNLHLVLSRPTPEIFEC